MATPEGRHLRFFGGTGHRLAAEGVAPISVLSRDQIDGRVLAPTVHLKIELKLVALVQLTHARTLDCTDVHERIRLAIITRDEAEALHGIEELHGACCLLAGQLTLGSSGLGRHCNHVTYHLQVSRGDLSATINEIELKLLTLGKTFKPCTLDCTDVDEHVLTTVFALDEAEALLRVEELDDALAGTDDLGRHSAATSAAARAAEATTTAAATRAAAEAAAAIAAAEATTVTAAETAAITAAETTAIATAAETAAVKTTAAETAAAAVGVETAFVTETIALVASATPPPSVKTHKNQ